MTAPAPAPSAGASWSRQRVAALALAAAVLAVFVAANAHLIAVSFASQPDCVAHAKSPVEGVATYRAAKPSC